MTSPAPARRMTVRLPEDIAAAAEADAEARGLSLNRWLEHAARQLLASQPAHQVLATHQPPPMKRAGALGRSEVEPITKPARRRS